MKKQNIKVSVIVPVYNVAPYLARCLDSLVGQTLRNIEIICIDDKSTDKSLSILHEYENKYPQITVIALDKNGGVSTARNAGIAAARGEYLGFVDSDDYIDTDFYEKLYDAATKSNSDIAHANVKITSVAGVTTVDNSEIRNIEQHGKWYFAWQWWSAIYRADLVKNNNISFSTDIISGEDTLFLVKALAVTQSVSIVSDTYYYYIRRDGSLDEQIMSIEKIAARVRALVAIGDIYNTAVMSPQDYVSRYAWAMGGLYSHCFKNTSEQSRNLVIDALIRMYTTCRDKGGISREVNEFMGPRAAACLKSYDKQGIISCINNSAGIQAASVQRDTFYLFGAIPLVRTIRTADRFLVKFCGIDVLKIKSASTDFRLWVLHVPIIRKKRKFK